MKIRAVTTRSAATAFVAVQTNIAAMGNARIAPVTPNECESWLYDGFRQFAHEASFAVAK